MGNGQRTAASDMRRLIWSPSSVANLTHIRAYVGNYSPIDAHILSVRLHAAAESLIEHPERGRTVGAGLRQLMTARPYLIRYRITDDAVIILRIRHGARRQN